MIDQVFPKEVRKSENATEMKIELISGSIWQLAGSDNFDSLVGSNPVGVVFSEWPLTNPSAWDYVRPILAENGGWALFIYTPRGRNHGYRLFQTAEKLDHWFAEKLTVDETGIIGPEAIEEDRASGMAEELIEQEYYVSFDSALVGSYFGADMKKLRKQGRVTQLPHEPELPVYTSWDIGVGDSTSIWWYQLVGRNIHWIDYYESSGAGIDHYVRKLKEKEAERDFVYADHWAPHDIRVREWGTGRSRAEQAKTLGVRFRVAPQLSFEDGINAVRAILKRSVFDAHHCERGIDALETYRKEWDQDKGMFKERPVHDWSSHPVDALRYGAVSIKDRLVEPAPKFPEQRTIGQQMQDHFRKKRRERVQSMW